MATFYGPWVATDDFRAILEATVTNTSATRCTVKLVLKIQSNYAYAGVSGRASVTCDGTTRSDSVSYDAGKTTTLMTETFTVARGSSKKSVSVSGKVWQLNASSAYSRGSTASGKVTIPAVDYDAPSAPSSCSASRASDTQAKVTWKNGSTSTTRPRSSTKVERQTDSGSWAQVASVGASATNFTDNSISANRRYRYRVRAYGAGGYSTYSTSGYIYTTPSAPRSVSAAVTGAGTSVRITVDGSNATWASAWEVQSSLNGGAWTAVGTFTSFPTTADIGGGTVRLRARSLRGSLASAWTESAEITTITPPLAPAVTVAGGASVAPTGTDLVVSWVPNHPDGSAQTSAQVEYTIGPGSSKTATVSGTTTTYLLPAATEPAIISVRVRTHGADEDWGAWSGQVFVTVDVPPSVYFSVPPVDGAAIGILPLTVEWDVADSTGVASQSIALLDASGRTLYSTELGPSVRELVLGDSTYRLSNMTEYVLRITARGGSSLTTTAERSFRTNFAEPASPTAHAETDPSDMSVAVSVRAGAASSASGEIIEIPAAPGTVVPGLTVYGTTSDEVGKLSIAMAGKNLYGGNSKITAPSYLYIDVYPWLGDVLIGKKVRVSFDLVTENGGDWNVYAYQGSGLSITFSPDGTTLETPVTVNAQPGVTYHFSVTGTVFRKDVEGMSAGQLAVYKDSLEMGDVSVSNIQIELGEVETDYEPYSGSITAIDLDGHTLNSLPDGTRDELRIDGTGAVTLVQRVGVATAPQEVELPSISMPSFPADPSTIFCASDAPCAVQVDYPATSSLTVQRVAQDGPRWTVADGLLSGQQAIDPLPPLNVPYSYEVTAYTEAGSTYTTIVEHTVDAGTRGAYNFGLAAAECLVTQFDFEDSVSADHGGELYHFAGQELPLFYAVGQVDVSSDQSFHLIGRDVWDRCRELFREYPVCWVRKPDGSRQRVVATASIDTKAGSPVAEVSVSGDEIVFEEAW